MTRRIRTALTLNLVSAFALTACTADIGASGGELSDIIDTPQICEPEMTLPLRLVADPTGDIGAAVVTTSPSMISVTVSVSPGWEIGDLYVAAGPDPSTLSHYSTNTEPWITGWFETLTIDIPVADLGLSCDSDFKLFVQAYVRSGGDSTTRQLASAYGRYGGSPWGWWDYYAVCCPSAGCTYTQGYWKNHASEWPVTSLYLGDRSYSQSELMALSRTPVRGDISVALAHQLIAAQLNHENGASSVSAIGDAHAWMTANGGGGPLPYGISPRSPEGAQGAALNDALSDYNEGLTGPGHCD